MGHSWKLIHSYPAGCPPNLDVMVRDQPRGVGNGGGIVGVR